MTARIGSGSSAIAASCQFIQNIIAAINAIIATSRIRLIEPNTIKSQSRSVSFVTRVIREPVRCLEK